jgi:alkylated DNA repair dioxygenase AlkB
MEAIEVKDGTLYLEKEFMPAALADKLMEHLKATVKWQQKVTPYGVPMPRLTGYFADKDKNYKYSGIIQIAEEWTKPILILKEKVEKAAGTDFNSLLLNYYRNGKDSIGWHSDDERELVPNPIVASLTLGASRNFELKHKKGAKIGRLTLPLTHGSLLVMGETIQQHWLHAVLKTEEDVGERINLTFRKFL